MEKKIEKKNAAFKESAVQNKSRGESTLQETNTNSFEYYVFSGEDRKKKKWDPTALYF